MCVEKGRGNQWRRFPIHLRLQKLWGCNNGLKYIVSNISGELSKENTSQLFWLNSRLKLEKPVRQLWRKVDSIYFSLSVDIYFGFMPVSTAGIFPYIAFVITAPCGRIMISGRNGTCHELGKASKAVVMVAVLLSWVYPVVKLLLSKDYSCWLSSQEQDLSKPGAQKALFWFCLCRSLFFPIPKVYAIMCIQSYLREEEPEYSRIWRFEKNTLGDI